MTRLVVAPGGVITSAWGNQAMDQGTIIFTGTAQRDADWPAPPDGAQCYVTGVGWQRRVAGSWRTTIDSASTGGAVINGAGARVVQSGSSIVATSASGVFNIPHTLGVVPLWAVVTCNDRGSGGGPWVAALHQGNWTTTAIEGVAYLLPGMALLPSKSIRVGWIAGIA